MRHRLPRLVVVVLACFSMAPGNGCLPPQRIDVSPDGKTMYFSLTDKACYKSEKSSNMYALDVEKARLRALTDAKAEEGWCTLTPDGKNLLYMQYTGELGVQSLDLEEGAVKPVSGVVDPHGYPTVIPSEEGTSCLLMLRTRVLDTENPSSWVLYAGDKWRPVPLLIPKGFASIWHGVATAANRFAVFMAREIKDEHDKAAKERWEVVIFVVDITHKEVRKEDGEGTKKVHETKVTRAARWEFGEHDTSGETWHLAFSPDGKRLVAVVPFGGDEKGNTPFLEIDPTGKIPPRVLFKDQDAFRPEWTPEGKAIVYMRMRLENAGWREMVLRPLEGKEPVVLARLPGGPLGAATCLRWDAMNILTAYHLSNDGVRIARIHPDLKSSEAKRLSREKLEVQRHLADIQLSLERLADLPQGRAHYKVQRVPRTEGEKAFNQAVKAARKPADEAQENVRERLKPIYQALHGTDAEIRATLEPEWDKVDDWEKVPPIPDLLDQALEEKAAELQGARGSLKELPETEDPAEREQMKRSIEDQIRRLKKELETLKEMWRLRKKE